MSTGGPALPQEFLGLKARDLSDLGTLAYDQRLATEMEVEGQEVNKAKKLVDGIEEAIHNLRSCA